MAFKITIVTPGQHDKSVIPLIAEYQKRASRFLEISWQILPSGNQPSELKQLKDKLGGSDYTALDERGKNITTSHIAKFIDNRATSGKSSLIIVIGGAYGLDDEIRNNALELWAFGKITLPHQLTRIILSEQLYRAASINAGLPYHHS